MVSVAVKKAPCFLPVVFNSWVSFVGCFTEGGEGSQMYLCFSCWCCCILSSLLLSCLFVGFFCTKIVLFAYFLRWWCFGRCLAGTPLHSLARSRLPWARHAIQIPITVIAFFSIITTTTTTSSFPAGRGTNVQIGCPLGFLVQGLQSQKQMPSVINNLNPTNEECEYCSTDITTFHKGHNNTDLNPLCYLSPSVTAHTS